MAITVDQATLGATTASGPGASPATWHTTTAAVAATGYAIVSLNYFGTGTVSAVSIGGNAMTLLKAGVAGTNDNAALWGYYSAAGIATSAVVTVTFSGTITDRIAGGMSLLGVNSAAPSPSSTGPTANASTTWASASNTLSAGGALVGSAFQEGFTSMTNTPAAGVSEAYDTTFDGNGYVLAYRIEAAGGSFTVGGTWTNGAPGVNVAAVIAPSGGAASLPPIIVLPPRR